MSLPHFRLTYCQHVPWVESAAFGTLEINYGPTYQTLQLLSAPPVPSVLCQQRIVCSRPSSHRVISDQMHSVPETSRTFSFVSSACRHMFSSYVTVCFYYFQGTCPHAIYSYNKLACIKIFFVCTCWHWKTVLDVHTPIDKDISVLYITATSHMSALCISPCLGNSYILQLFLYFLHLTFSSYSRQTVPPEWTFIVTLSKMHLFDIIKHNYSIVLHSWVYQGQLIFCSNHSKWPFNEM